jgi:aminoglycoside phosphotransferase (APT) family kinase protein
VKVRTSRSVYLSHPTCYVGSYNKVVAHNRVEAIARLPTALAGVPFFTTASEVATLKSVREVLGVPAPRVFAWSADAATNPVGSEYIIMEKMSGVESHHRGRILRKDLKSFRFWMVL